MSRDRVINHIKNRILKRVKKYGADTCAMLLYLYKKANPYIFLILLLSIVFIKPSICIHAEQDKALTFSLTEEEAAYDEKIKGDTVSIAVTKESDYYIDQDGNETGCIVPLIWFFEDELGLNIVVIQKEAKDLTSLPESPDYQLIFKVSEATAEQDENYGYTVTFARRNGSLYELATVTEEYVKLLKLFDRYANQTQEGDSLATHMDYLEERYSIVKFNEENQNLLDIVNNKYDIVYWSAASVYDNPLYYEMDGTTAGAIFDLLDYIESMTGLQFQYKAADNYDDNLTALEDNQIQLLTGAVKTRETSDKITYSSPLFESELVCIVKTEDYDEAVKQSQKDNSPFIEEEVFKEVYWGVDNQFMAILETSPLHGRVVNYNSTSELLEALENNEINGMILRNSTLDYLNTREKENCYCKVLEESTSFTEYIALSTDNKKLNMILNSLIDQYIETYPTALQSTSDTKKASEESWVTYLRLDKIPIWAIISCCGFLVLILLIRIISYHNKGSLHSRNDRSHRS